MDVMEKLVELLGNLFCGDYGIDGCGSCKYNTEVMCSAHACADRLIANGVTVQKWISVKDRFPEEEQDVLCSRGNHIGALMDVYTYMGDDKWDDTYGNRSCTEDEGITHWQYLPQPPKGE